MFAKIYVKAFALALCISIAAGASSCQDAEEPVTTYYGGDIEELFRCQVAKREGAYDRLLCFTPSGYRMESSLVLVAKEKKHWQGPMAIYYPSGEVYTTGWFKRGRKWGRWEEFSKEGSLVRVQHYRADTLWYYNEKDMRMRSRLAVDIASKIEDGGLRLDVKLLFSDLDTFEVGGFAYHLQEGELYKQEKIAKESIAFNFPSGFNGEIYVILFELHPNGKISALEHIPLEVSSDSIVKRKGHYLPALASEELIANEYECDLCDLALRMDEDPVDIRDE